jgi:hypothetical protein
MTCTLDRKQLVDLALSAGEKFLSPQTGLIHYCYEDERSKETIPLFENLCYCLALFRTHTLDHVLSAKERLKHLLAFQYEEGRFPVYLHQYPNIVGSYRTAYPLYLIDKHFAKVIEEPLRSQIRKELKLPLPPQTITSSKEAGLVALHRSALGQNLDPLKVLWDPILDLYCGPLGAERARQGEIETTLFDLFMGSSPRILKPHPIHLHASLVFYGEEEGDKVEIGAPEPLGKGYHLFRYAWAEGDHLHTLVCQDKEIKKEGMTFIYQEKIPDEKHFNELTFYTDRSPEKTILINGEKGTIFSLGDRVTIHTPSKTVTLTFHLAEGEGDFLGQLSFGNRPAQIETRDFVAYDWKITLRTLRRLSTVKIGMHIQ